jgi:hypothetical protein
VTSPPVFDVIVVGGGAAGCAHILTIMIAERLSDLLPAMF